MKRITKDGTLRAGTNRRDFLKHSAAVAGLGVWVASAKQTWAVGEQSANEKLNVASIGVGGKGDSDSDQVSKYANLVAICDVDENTLNKKASRHPKAKKFTDYRKMLEEMGKEIDACTISIPDHNHATATMMAIKMGKHVYTQKPMTHDVYEARQLRMAAKEHKIASQMGNQGTASPKLREGVELIRAGVLGAIKEVHIWTNRPVWPQSPQIKARPPEAPVPSSLHWDEWIGTAPLRPYVKEYYHDFKWRGWWDFGTGALGDMGCHTANLPFMALKLGHPTSMHGESEELNPETYPAWARVNYEFPAREGMPPVKVTWYEGRKDGKLVHPPEELTEKVLSEYSKILATRKDKRVRDGKTVELNNSGSIIVGDKGMLYSPHDYGGEWELLPAEDYRDYKAASPTLARNPEGGDDGQKMEWIAAAKGGPPAFSNFEYAGMLTEFILLGNVAIKAQGTKLDWDGPSMKIPNAPEAEKFLRREYRKPWSL
ncbi:MAG: iolG 4 [Phycisphaerales bacterium]|nr:iolG 4 [Phycisphaerales bacterium]